MILNKKLLVSSTIILVSLTSLAAAMVDDTEYYSDGTKSVKGPIGTKIYDRNGQLKEEISSDGMHTTEYYSDGTKSVKGPIDTKIYDRNGQLKEEITSDGMYTTKYYSDGTKSVKGPGGTKIYDRNGNEISREAP